MLIYHNCSFFQNHKTNFCNYLHSSGDIYMIYNKDNTQKYGECLSIDVDGSWR